LLGVVTAINGPNGDIGRRRKPLRLGHVLMTLEHLLIVTWRLPETEVRRHLPPALRPVVEDGSGFVSAVVFRNRALRPAVIEFPSLGMSQMNVRVYVRSPRTGEPGSVFFLGLYGTRRLLVRVSSRLFGLPIHYLAFEVTARDHSGGIEWSARAGDGRLAIHAREADADMKEPTLDLLTNPHTGYFLDRRGVLRRWSIWHRPQRLHTMHVESATLDCMPDLNDLKAASLLPALFVRSVDYEVYFPPRAAS
jgi:uncharacterized protein YqjF (DUF2071 family)